MNANQNIQALNAGPNRLAALDVLRGVAILLVLVQHMPNSLAQWYPTAALKLFGWSGVDLFFVLSGYLISSLLFRELNETGTLGVGRFLLRRGLKIWPSYFVAYGLMTLSHLISWGVRGRFDKIQEILGTVWPNLIFIQNYWPSVLRWPHSWSLAVEEHFYIGLPLLLTVLWKIRRSTLVPAICGVLCAGVLIWRIVVAVVHGYSWDDLYYPTHFRLDALLCGVLIGYSRANHSLFFSRIAQKLRYATWLVIIVPVLAIGFRPESSIVIPTVGFTVFYLSYGLLVWVGAGEPQIFSGRRGRYLSESLRFLGRYSYTIYLGHSVIYEISIITPLKWFFRTYGGVLGEAVLYFSATILSGVLLSKAIELPVLAWREKHLPAWRCGAGTPLPAVNTREATA